MRNVKILKLYFFIIVLVCIDECVDDMKIDDVNVVIYFDLFFEFKIRFGNRLLCMRKYYVKYLEFEEVLVIFIF